MREISDTWARILFLQSSHFMASGVSGVFIVVAGKTYVSSGFFVEMYRSNNVVNRFKWLKGA